MDPALIIPILALSIPIVIPTVAILTAHQRKMAELFHRNQASGANSEVAALRQEVQELKQLIHQQAIAMDNVIALQTRQTPVSTIEERIGNRIS